MGVFELSSSNCGKGFAGKWTALAALKTYKVARWRRDVSAAATPRPPPPDESAPPLQPPRRVTHDAARAFFAFDAAFTAAGHCTHAADAKNPTSFRFIEIL